MDALFAVQVAQTEASAARRILDRKSKVAVVTGASSGIGRAIAWRLVDERCDIYNVSRTNQDAAFFHIECDLSVLELDTISEMFYDIETPDVLVLNAGVMPFEPLASVEDAVKLFRTNVLANWALLEYFLPRMKLHGGSILTVSSTAGLGPSAWAPLYGMTKAAVASMTKSYAARGAPSVRVNSIAPGFTATNLAGEEPTPSHLIDEHVPLGFEASPEMIASLAMEIIGNPFMTGSIVLIDGGEMTGSSCD